ncbi:SctK family type III secretion system sorting platform protein [Ideonella sp. BN130291]|uniref:SctK family type III secretion system sorting platform protein n=1 Tax=Ideonella sp. BN130291 TaxID=3112940 RepID=UPI002E2764C5|nr:SctK family type III secretion system sorting platform protein [Ideonella sp. BN130291]
MNATMDLLRLASRLRLQPEAELHPSWLPTEWPLRHRHIERLGPGGRAALADWLRTQTPDVGFNFDTPARRLVLLDGRSLRRMALYCALVAHAPLMRQRGELGSQLRRQARRIDRDAQRVVLERLPAVPSLKVDTSRLEQRPIAAGRVLVNRGYRLLQGAVAPQGDAVLQRLQRKLPRRAALLRLPPLQPRQLDQLQELMLMAIVPERLAQWDWLF